MRQRSEIRWAAIAALTNSDAPPWPTMAEDRVYDSRQDPLIHQRGQSPLPAILVYTDNVDYVPINKDGGPPFRCRGELIVELSLSSFDAEVQTDAEMEARLDLFEEQVMEAFFDYSKKTACQFRKTHKRVIKAESVRLANSTANHRLALRDLLFVLEWDSECMTATKAFPSFNRIFTVNATGAATIVTKTEGA